MTLVELLIVICFTTTLTFAVERSHHVKAGLAGYALGIALGLPLALGAAFVMYWVIRRAVAAVQSAPKWKENLFSGFLILFMFLWILLSAYLADQVVSAALRLLARGS
jgi:F0F1-type ATP synthase membrane subunit c/vacuolar-type H+-ATPase subunit K